MYPSPQPQRPPWPHILCAGEWIEVTPAWISAQLQTGLTPHSADVIALAAHQIGLSFEQLHRVALAFVAIESEVTL